MGRAGRAGLRKSSSCVRTTRTTGIMGSLKVAYYLRGFLSFWYRTVKTFSQCNNCSASDHSRTFIISALTT